MPQAPKALQDKWVDDSTALHHLRPNFRVNRSGVIHPNENYKPTPEDFSAIDYLVMEWDYGYEPN